MDDVVDYEAGAGYNDGHNGYLAGLPQHPSPSGREMGLVLGGNSVH